MSDKITIIRATKNADNPYVVLRKAVPQDKGLSWEARGMLSYILSQPDNWKIIPKNLEQNCGKSVVYRILNELIAAGYIKRKPNRDQNQRFVSWIYEVYEVPQPKDTAKEKEPLPKNPEMAQPEMENRDALLSTDSLPSTDSTKKDSTSGVADVPSPEADKPSNGHEPTPKKERPRDWVFDAIALGSFKINDTTGLDKITGKRIGIVASWLKKQDGINQDGETVALIGRFYEWYDKAKNGIARPRDVTKFAEAWVEWQSYKAAPPSNALPATDWDDMDWALPEDMLKPL
jgi:hypothetical protein